ncbi:glycine-rich domain-containing protein-like [Pseudoduganella sp. FT93W]|uniref:Glycine-rich domain-containing protein-like n=1 Tax=Duganella fentianensis TaxID=2692177 RepID=A0A845I4D6_9BURK|nr:glycine-rich domain-containing protein-like [Duganella fentianensis]MYN47207.1 glycine-rich domain-containing protein-like [Duganella fentianensis]
MNVIDALDLEPIKVKLMHKESGEGWTLEHANAVEREYRRFLYLMKTFPQEQAAPLVDVDTFWHYHILDTLKYAEDCQAVFGHFLHHFPYIGLRGEDDLAAHERLGVRMQQLYEETFGTAYPLLLGAAEQQAQGSAYSAVASQTAYSAVAAKTAYSAVAQQTAYSAVARQTAYSAVAAKTAYSAVAAQTAYSAVSAPGQRSAYSAVSNSATGQNADSGLFTVRPRLPQAA